MKPRGRPGKVVSDGKAARAIQAKAKALTPEQVEHLGRERAYKGTVPKAGKGGQRAKWDIDFEQGCRYAAKNMPCREAESFSKDGIRQYPKNKH